MKNIINFFVDRTRATIFVLLVLLLHGYTQYNKIPKEYHPEVNIPMMYISVHKDGISPQDSERLLIKPIERHTRSIKHIKEISGASYDGGGHIILKFDANFDNKTALDETRSAIDKAIPDLPKDLKRPKIQEITTAEFPIMKIGILGDVSEIKLTNIAKSLKDKIEKIPGVDTVKLLGKREEVIEAIIDRHIIEEYGISVPYIRKIISENNALIALGSIKTLGADFSMTIKGSIENLRDLMNLPITNNKNSSIKVQDIIKANRTLEDPTEIVRIDGQKAVIIQISKNTGASIIKVADNIKELVAQEEKKLANGIAISYQQDDSRAIRGMISDLENGMALAILLIVLVVVLSVGIKPAFLISVSIPASFFATIIMIGMQGYTLNVVLLFSLILTVGMVIDDAIVVSEYAQRQISKGYSPKEAFVDSAYRMLWPVFTSTLVKIIVFAPLLFWPGVMGQYMKYMPITVILILSSSLVFALCFQPAMGGLMYKASTTSTHDKDQNIDVYTPEALKMLRGLSLRYKNMLEFALTYPKTIILCMLLFCGIVIVLFVNFNKGMEFFPNTGATGVRIAIKSSDNIPCSKKDRLIQNLSKQVHEITKEHADFLYSKTTCASSNTKMIGEINAKYHERITKHESLDLSNTIRGVCSEQEGLTIDMNDLKEGPGPPNQKPVLIRVLSENQEHLNKHTSYVKEQMLKIGTFTDIETDQESGGLQWQIIPDLTEAAKHGISATMIGDIIRLAGVGTKISSYNPYNSDEQIDIKLRLPKKDRNISLLKSLKIVNLAGETVAIGDFITIKPKKKISNLTRFNQEKVITIHANVLDGVVIDNEIKKLSGALVPSDNVKIEFGGEAEDQQETSDFLAKAFIASLALMLIVILIQFNNIYQSLVIMSAVFLSTIGVLLGHLIASTPFSIVMSGIGIIALGGIVLNNNILFVDTYSRLRKQNIETKDAILFAGISRLRPILLTAATAVLGLMPMTLGITIDFFDRTILYDVPSSRLWRPLSTSIAGGLTFATILTLFITPCFLILSKKIQKINRSN